MRRSCDHDFGALDQSHSRVITAGVCPRARHSGDLVWIRASRSTARDDGQWQSQSACKTGTPSKHLQQGSHVIAGVVGGSLWDRPVLSKCREFGVGDVQLEPPRQGDGAQTMSDRESNPARRASSTRKPWSKTGLWATSVRPSSSSRRCSTAESKVGEPLRRSRVRRWM